MVVNKTAVENETEEFCDPTTEESVDLSIACQVELEISSDGSSCQLLSLSLPRSLLLDETFEQLEKKMSK